MNGRRYIYRVAFDRKAHTREFVKKPEKMDSIESIVVKWLLNRLKFV